MTKYGFKSERALCLLFDICVQMGSITLASHKRYMGAVSRSTSEQLCLIAMAEAVVPQAGRWGFDVRARKMAIARGTGIVHGRSYNMSTDFGVTDAPVAT
jgi:hypothetical protein